MKPWRHGTMPWRQKMQQQQWEWPAPVVRVSGFLLEQLSWPEIVAELAHFQLADPFCWPRQPGPYLLELPTEQALLLCAACFSSSVQSERRAHCPESITKTFAVENDWQISSHRFLKSCVRLENWNPLNIKDSIHTIKIVPFWTSFGLWTPDMIHYHWPKNSFDWRKKYLFSIQNKCDDVSSLHIATCIHGTQCCRPLLHFRSLHPACSINLPNMEVSFILHQEFIIWTKYEFKTWLIA